jgi:hypothetical protein
VPAKGARQLPALLGDVHRQPNVIDRVCLEHDVAQARLVGFDQGE